MSDISLRPLSLVNEERYTFGLRYNDHARYRKHCSKKVHNLRSSLKMTHGKGNEFKKLPPITAQTLKEGHLQLLLFEAERAWAYGSELLMLSVKEDDSLLRRRAIARFRRAVSWSQQLLTLTTDLFSASRISASNFAEASVYVLVLHGQVMRHREDFEAALARLVVAKSMLDQLATSATTSRDQALATVFADEISPEIRYCAHELGRARAFDIDAVVAEFAPKHRVALMPNYDLVCTRLAHDATAGGANTGRKRLAPLSWEGSPVSIRNPELVDVFLRVQEAEAKIDIKDAPKPGAANARTSRNRVANFDATLSALSDAEDVARKLLEAQQLSNTSAQPSVPGTRDLQFLHAYITYRLISRRVQRDLALSSALLVSSPSKDNGIEEAVDDRLYPAVIKLFDTVLQSLTQMRSLSIVDESQDLGSGIEARLSFSRAKRCLFLARSYASVNKFAEAVSLAQSARLLLRETNALLADTSADSEAALKFYPLSPTSDAAEFDNELERDERKFKLDWFAFNGGTASAEPPSTRSHKPLFFDIALNYVELPMDRLLERAGKASPTAAVPKAAPAKTQEVKEPEPAPAPIEAPAPVRTVLGSLLGGWWSKK